MALIEIVREVDLSPEVAWQRMTAWERHGELVPLTKVSRTDTGILARTGVGKLGFDDPMDVVTWDPPRICRLEKRGRWVLGWAEVEVAPSGSGSRVVWREDINIRWCPRLLGGLIRWSAAHVFGRVVDGLLTPD